jgi:hypothetical protein
MPKSFAFFANNHPKMNVTEHKLCFLLWQIMGKVTQNGLPAP